MKNKKKNIKDKKKIIKDNNKKKNIKDKKKIIRDKKKLKLEKKKKINIESLIKRLTEEKNRFLRFFAEFENYKKRVQKERIEVLKYANQNLMYDLLLILDDFNRGIKEIKKSKEKILIKGVFFIKKKFIQILKKNGLKKIKTKKGDNFNTDFHEAITQISVHSKKLKGKIIEILENGYYLYDKVIRYTKVVVGK
jgi:molecular chaperone GrpE